MAGLLSPNTWQLGRRERGVGAWVGQKRERVKKKNGECQWMEREMEKGRRGCRGIKKKKKKQRWEWARPSPATRLYEGKLIARKATFQITLLLLRKNPLLSRINEDGTLFLHRKPCRKKESAMNSRRKHRWRNTLIRHQNHARTKHCCPKYGAKAFCQFHRKK